YLESLGVTSSGVDQLIKSAYRVLGLMSFLTGGEKEARAWTIPQGSRAQDAAGAIHSDIARGFIRAEIVGYDDLMRAGSYAAAREQGLLRLEGKDYIMQEGDVVNFRFNVSCSLQYRANAHDNQINDRHHDGDFDQRH